MHPRWDALGPALQAGRLPRPDHPPIDRPPRRPLPRPWARLRAPAPHPPAPAGRIAIHEYLELEFTVDPRR